MYCIAKGKDHKRYEYGNKVSIANTAKKILLLYMYYREIKKNVCY